MNFLKSLIRCALIGALCLFYSGTLSAIEVNEPLDLRVKRHMEEGNIPGLSMAIIDEGDVYIRTYGIASATKEVDENTLFEIGSNTKAFTALAIRKLEAAGLLSLTDKVDQYIPNFKLYYEGEKAEIKIDHLLYHSSGIPWHTISLIPESSNDESLRSTVEKINGIDLISEPGDRFGYATVNYDILGLIIEIITGKSYEEYVTTEILRPLGLNNTYVGKKRAEGHNLAQGHKISFSQAKPYNAPTFRGNNPAGYIISNITDMVRWLRIQMGQIDTPLSGLIRKSHIRDRTVPPFMNTSYAGGWKVSIWGDRMLFHEGLNPNYSSYIGFYPEVGKGVIILSNSNSGHVDYLGKAFMFELKGKEVPAEISPDKGMDGSFSMASYILIFYLTLAVAFTSYVVYDIIRKKRAFAGLNKSQLKGIAVFLLFSLPCFGGIYLLPEAFANFSWDAVRIWAPDSLYIMAVLLSAAFVISYVAYLITLLFPDSNRFKQIIPQTVVVSIVSGLSNMLLILLITSSLTSNIALKYLLFYYGLSLLLYIAGRRYVQLTLIKFTRDFIFEVRMNLITKILSTSFQKFEKLERGRVLATLNGDIAVIGSSAYMVITLVTSIITTIGAFIYLASIAFWATMLTLGLVVAISSIHYVVGKRARPMFEHARDTRNTLNSYINDLINGFKEISIHGLKKHEFRADIEETEIDFKTKMKKAESSFVVAFLIGESLLIMVLGVVAFALPEVFPDIKLGVLMSFIIVLLYLIGPVNNILRSIPEFLQLKVVWNRVKGFRKEIPSDLPMDALPKITKTEKVNSFRVHNLSFSYAQEDQLFKVGPIDFDLNGGEIMFVIGGNGSGKSTLAKLLTGLYPASEGTIEVNGQELKGTALGEYYSAIFSPVHLFKKLYNVEVDKQESNIEYHLDRLKLSDKVSIDVDGFSTLNLSNGQQKRLALLQSYLEERSIYLFDEWAADQDPEYRKFFYEELLPEMRSKGKIVIAITHDDHYFDIADKVLKLDMGQIEYIKNNAHESLVQEKISQTT